MSVNNNWAIKSRVLKRKIFSFFFKHTMPLPISADIEPTRYCNLKCIMCQRTNSHADNKHMSIETAKYILDQIPSLEKVKLQGIGEPLLNPYFFDIVKLMTAKGIEISTITNGTVLPQDILSKITKSGIKYFFVSVDSLDQKVYQSIRGVNTLPLVIENLKKIVNHAPSTTEIGVLTVVMNNNVDELNSMAHDFISMEVKSLGFQVDLTQWGSEDWKTNQNLQADSVKLETVIQQVSDTCRNNQIKMEIIKNRHLQRGEICQWPFHNVFITCDGYIQPCCKITNPEMFSFGNINDKPFSKIWNGRKYRMFRKNMKNGRAPEFCKMCFTD